MDNLITSIASNDSQSNNAEKTAIESEEKPLMLLFQRLIGNDNKQNTVLTNAQIINILDKEFDIKVTNLHELEVDIYLNVMKKFLKDWPRWDEFDKILTRLRNAKDQEMITKTLDHKYSNLKQYLQGMLNVTQPIAQQAVQKIIKETAQQNVSKEPPENLDVVLEINCTREQLNNLIFKQPQPSLNNTIFNTEFKRPVIVASGKIPLKTMLQWSNIKISINLKNLCYIRTSSSNLKHMLVNKAHSVSSSLDSTLNDDLQIKIMNAKKCVKWEKQTIKDFFQNIILKSCNNSEFNDLLVNTFEILKMDFEDCPQIIYVPGSYKKYDSKYAYVRYLNAESDSIPECADKFNLQLEEIIHPMHKFTINKLIKMSQNEKIYQSDWFHIECTDCSQKFSGKDLLKTFTEHFNMKHFSDLGCMCTNCNVYFSLLYLIENRWRHTCATS